MVFADGENLLLRYEAMLGKGRKPRPKTTTYYSKNRYIWSYHITKIHNLEFTRVTYYTTFVGDEDALQRLRADLATVAWASNMMNPPNSGHIHPAVFKKHSQSQKTSSVDINITIDLLRHCYNKDIEAVYILTGDGDYIPLVEEAVRTGTRVFVGAFSDGLNETLRVVGDEFINLDDMFFGD